MKISRLSAGLLAPFLLWVAGAGHGLEDCSPYLAEMDAKIEAAKTAGMNVEAAAELREQITQMCVYLDDATLKGMVDGLDMMLPLMADLETMVAEAEAAEAASPAVASKAIAVREAEAVTARALPVIGRSLGGRLIDRPDAMHQFGIWDMDLHQGKARVVYHTRPDRLQFAGPDWEFVTYAALVDDRGKTAQHLIDRRQASGQDGMVLRRGRDEVIIYWQRGYEDDSPALERWSLNAPSMLSKVPSPAPEWPGSELVWKAPFLSSTADGNLFYIGTRPEKRGASDSTLAWFEAAPDGEILSQGALTRPESLGATWAIESRHGGGAAIIMVSTLGENGIESRLQTPIRREVAGRDIHAAVHMEKRLFIVDGTSFWESPALERMLSWQGDIGVSQDLSAGEMLRQSQVQMSVMNDANLEYGASRTVESLNVGLEHVEMIQPMSAGRYAVLMRVTTDRNRTPPVHGQYLYVADKDTVDELVYLEPLAESADIRFTVLAVSPSDQVYLGATPNAGGQKRIYRVSSSGELEGYATSDAGQAITLEGLVANGTGVWAFGRGIVSGVIGERLWVERLNFELD